MSRVFQAQLTLLSARRTTGLAVIAWVVIVITLALLAPPESAVFADHAAANDGLSRQRLWMIFLVGVAPLLILRAAQRVAPTQTNDAQWLATRAATNGSVALSQATGTAGAWCAIVLVFAGASEICTAVSEPQVIYSGSFDLPGVRWVTTADPIAWSANIPNAERPTSARIELGLGAGSGSAGAVRITARGRSDGAVTSAETRIGNRGTIEVDLPRGETQVDFELACSGEGTRAYVLSRTAELWTTTDFRLAACSAITLRLILIGTTWMALVLALATCVGGTTAACTLLAAWIPVWLTDVAPETLRWIPGGDLFEALEIVGAGRAPALPKIHNVLGCALVVALALVATAIGLRSWRVSR